MTEAAGAVTGKNKADFSQLYEEYYDRVYKYAYTILLNREDAEDVVAETFTAAYAFYNSFDPAKASFATWITRIAHNKAINLLKSAAYSKRAEMPEYYDVPALTEGADITAETNAAVLYLYSKLNGSEREFLNLRYAMGMKDGEIAELMGLPVKTVNKRYQRLLAKCRDIMERNGQKL